MHMVQHTKRLRSDSEHCLSRNWPRSSDMTGITQVCLQHHSCEEVPLERHAHCRERSENRSMPLPQDTTTLRSYDPTMSFLVSQVQSSPHFIFLPNCTLLISTSRPISTPRCSLRCMRASPRFRPPGPPLRYSCLVWIEVDCRYSDEVYSIVIAVGCASPVPGRRNKY